MAIEIGRMNIKIRIPRPENTFWLFVKFTICWVPTDPRYIIYSTRATRKSIWIRDTIINGISISLFLVTDATKDMMYDIQCTIKARSWKIKAKVKFPRKNTSNTSLTSPVIISLRIFKALNPVNIKDIIDISLTWGKWIRLTHVYLYVIFLYSFGTMYF